MEPWLILALAVVCVGVLTGVVPSRNSLMAAAMVFMAGLAFGPIFPAIMAILLGHFSHRLHGRAVGLLFAIGGIGWTVIPILIGAYAGEPACQRGLGLAVAAVTGMIGSALALAMQVKVSLLMGIIWAVGPGFMPTVMTISVFIEQVPKVQ